MWGGAIPVAGGFINDRLVKVEETDNAIVAQMV